MNVAWGGIYDTNQVMACLADDHKTTENIKKADEIPENPYVDDPRDVRCVLFSPETCIGAILWKL